jgi:hypothetical protein
MIKTTTPETLNFSISNEDLLRFAEEKFPEEPGQHVIDSLLRYSRSLEIKPSKLVGMIESVTN